MTILFGDFSTATGIRDILKKATPSEGLYDYYYYYYYDNNNNNNSIPIY
jgi:hypothetical protein